MLRENTYLLKSRCGSCENVGYIGISAEPFSCSATDQGLSRLVSEDWASECRNYKKTFVLFVRTIKEFATLCNRKFEEKRMGALRDIYNNRFLEKRLSGNHKLLFGMR